MKKELPHKLNICLTSKKFPIIGRAADHSHLWMIAKKLAKKGHRITVLAGVSQQNFTEVEEAGVQVFYLNNKRTLADKDFQLKVKEKFTDLHAKEPFDLIHSVDSSGRKIINHYKHLKIPTALDIEATNISQIFSILGMTQESIGSAMRTSFAVLYKFLRTYYGNDRSIIRHAHGIFVSSPQQRLMLERYYLYPDKRIYTVAYGLEIQEEQKQENTAHLMEGLNLSPNHNILLTVTDMAEFQEMSNILRAFEKLVIKKPNSRLVIVGNGPKRKELEHETYKLALGNMVHFVGAIKNIEYPDYISLADIFINLSSRSTGFEPSILEAMSQKKIVIASEVSALSSLVEDRRDGFLVRPADIDGISQLLLDIINESIPVLEIGDRARRKVKSYFDQDKMITNTIDAYYDILVNSGFYKRMKL
ncbi:MAG: glycosyltransferase family 4 protein [Bdellovibrionales bacterium]